MFTLYRIKKIVSQKVLNLIIKNLKKDDIRIILSSKHNVYINDKSKIYKPYMLSDVKIDKGTYISGNSSISNCNIGKFCSIGPNICCGHGIHPTNGISTSPVFYSLGKQVGYTYSNNNLIDERKKINIGNDVFIGMNVTIIDGVTIGDGAIIGAGAVVSKDIPPYAIAVGSPIQIIRYRFDKETISRLLKLKWWDWPEEKLFLLSDKFYNIDEVLSI